MAAYNAEAYIGDAISSILAQSFEDWELIIVDDGSTDGTSAIIKDACSRDSRVRMLHQANSGLCGVARNSGLSIAKGQYICFLDADDHFESERLECALEVFGKYPHVGFLFHDMFIQLDGEPRQPCTYLENVNFREQVSDYVSEIHETIWLLNERFYVFMSLKYAAAHTNSVMMRSNIECKGGLRFREDLKIGEDTDLWLRVAEATTVAFLDATLCTHRLHEKGVTANGLDFAAGSLQVHLNNIKRVRSALSIEEYQAYRRKIVSCRKTFAYRALRAGRNRESLSQYMQCLGSPGAGPECWIGILKSLLPWAWLRPMKSSKQT